MVSRNGKIAEGVIRQLDKFFERGSELELTLLRIDRSRLENEFDAGIVHSINNLIRRLRHARDQYQYIKKNDELGVEP